MKQVPSWSWRAQSNKPDHHIYNERPIDSTAVTTQADVRDVRVRVTDALNHFGQIGSMRSNVYAVTKQLLVKNDECFCDLGCLSTLGFPKCILGAQHPFNKIKKSGF